MTPQEMMDYARFVASTFSRNHKVPFGLSMDDLASVGVEAILLAQQRYKVDNPTGAKFTTFIYQRVQGAMWDLIRQWNWSSRRDHSKKLISRDDMQALSHACDPIAEWIDVHHVQEILGVLTPKERQVLEMIYLGDFSGKDVAEAMNYSAVYISKLRYQALKKLQEVAVA